MCAMRFLRELVFGWTDSDLIQALLVDRRFVILIHKILNKIIPCTTMSL